MVRLDEIVDFDISDNQFANMSIPKRLNTDVMLTKSTIRLSSRGVWSPLHPPPTAPLPHHYTSLRM